MKRAAFVLRRALGWDRGNQQQWRINEKEYDYARLRANCPSGVRANEHDNDRTNNHSAGRYDRNDDEPIHRAP